jgi:hypothetical protein
VIATIGHNNVNCCGELERAVVKEDRSVNRRRRDHWIRGLGYNFGCTHRKGALRCDISDEHAVGHHGSRHIAIGS